MKKLLAILLSALLLSVLPAAAGATSDAELIAYWNFDELNEDATVSDLSGNDNTLFLNHDKYAMVNGFTGSAFDFSSQGSSGYDNYSKHMVADSDKIATLINGSSAVTITTMVKKMVKGSATNFCMFALNAGSNSILAYARASEMQFNARSDYASQIMSVKAANIYPNIDDSTSPDGWMHLALVVDYANDSMKIYADGVLVGYEKIVQSNVSQTFATDVASYKTDVGNIATGYFGVGGRHVLLDEMKIYRGGLSEEEIKRSVPAAMSYDFELENDMVKDACVGGMDMTAIGATVVPGVTGNTVQLSEPATLPVAAHRGMLYGAYEYSVSFWLKLSEGRLPFSTQAFFREGEKDAFRLELTPEGAISVGAKSANADNYRSITTPDGMFVSEDTSWHHIYADIDYRAKKGRIFVNGSLAAEGSLNFLTGYYNMSGLGSQYDVLDLSSDAPLLMDSLTFHRRKLTDSEILELVKELPMVTPVFSHDGTSVTATCNIINLSTEEIPADSASVILAAYDKVTNRMVNATFVKLPAIAPNRGLSGQEVTLGGLSEPENMNYKLFVWYGLDSVASYQDEIIHTFGE